jgi:hypothetical protein
MNNTIKTGLTGLIALSTIGIILLNKNTRELVKGLFKNCELLKNIKDNRKLKPEQISFC